MATHRASILGAATLPDTTGRAFLEPYPIKATNDFFKHLVFIFNDPASTEEHGFYGQFDVPQNYVGTAKVAIVWTSTATTGNCRWRFGYRTVGGDDTTSLDQASFEEQAAVTDAAPGAVNRRLVAEITLTAANFSPGETVEFYWSRFDDSGVDTMAAAAIGFDLLFQWSDA